MAYYTNLTKQVSFSVRVYHIIIARLTIYKLKKNITYDNSLIHII